MKKQILSLFILISLFFINTTVVNACSCVKPPPPKELLEKSSAVFAGKVIDIYTPEKTKTGENQYLKVTFDTSKIWKGPKNKKIVIKTNNSSAACGYTFEKDQEYVVYASYNTNDTLFTSLCSGTSKYEYFDDYLLELGEYSTPINYTPLYMVISIIGSLAVIITALMLIKKIKNKLKN